MAIRVVPYKQSTASVAGQKVAFTASVSGLAANTLVSELHVQPAAGNSGRISVYHVPTGIILKDLFPPPVNGKAESWSLRSEGQDGIDPTNFGVLFAHAKDKWNVYAVIQ
jgi:hypothetical protein